MSRTNAGVLLLAILHLSGCGSPVAPSAPLTVEEQAATGTYTLTLANGVMPPTKIGTFLSGGAGADVRVTGATLVLGADAKTRTARLNVTVEYVESDPINGVQKRTDGRETVAPWSLNGSTFSFQPGNPTFSITSGTLSGGIATVITSSPGLYGAGSPTVVLTLAKQ